jgi:hypothetical protein
VSLLERLKQKAAGVKEDKRLFAVIAGPRLGGKTTLAGTLPGKTYLLQAAVRESGSGSATALATEKGNELWVENFISGADLLKKLAEAATDTYFDNVVVDGLSAVTELKVDEDEMKKLAKKDNWAVYREVSDLSRAVILTLKEMTYPEKVAKAKNTFITCALTAKHDANGNPIDVSLDVKGNATVASVTKYGEAVLTVLPPVGDSNDHRLLTKSQGVWPARIDGLLASQNPGAITPANLGAVLALLKPAAKKGAA